MQVDEAPRRRDRLVVVVGLVEGVGRHQLARGSPTANRGAGARPPRRPARPGADRRPGAGRGPRCRAPRPGARRTPPPSAPAQPASASASTASASRARRNRPGADGLSSMAGHNIGRRGRACQARPGRGRRRARLRAMVAEVVVLAPATRQILDFLARNPTTGGRRWPPTAAAPSRQATAPSRQGTDMGDRTRPIDQHVGERIRLRRTERGLTQEQLARRSTSPISRSRSTRPGPTASAPAASIEIARKLGRRGRLLLRGARRRPGGPGAPLEHGGRQRSAIELVRKFAQIQDPEVRAAIAGLVKTIVERDG